MLQEELLQKQFDIPKKPNRFVSIEHIMDVGHSSFLHDWLSDESPSHPMSPMFPLLHWRYLCRVPSPQVALQDDQSVQSLHEAKEFTQNQDNSGIIHESS